MGVEAGFILPPTRRTPSTVPNITVCNEACMPLEACQKDVAAGPNLAVEIVSPGECQDNRC